MRIEFKTGISQGYKTQVYPGQTPLKRPPLKQPKTTVLQLPPPPRQNVNSEHLKAYYNIQAAQNLRQDLQFGALGTLSFGAKTDIGDIKLVKNYGRISCPCCGEKMRKFNEENAHKLAKAISGKTGDELCVFLLTNIGEFQASKRSLIEKIATNAPKYPNRNISELLTIVSKPYKRKLAEKQMAFAGEMSKELSSYGQIPKEDIENWYKNEIERLTYKQTKDNYRNAKLVWSYKDFAEEHGVKIKESKINDYFARMPAPAGDADSFVVHYMGKDPKKVAYHLIKNTSPTVEHIRVYSKTADDKLSSLLIMCEDCNSMRGSKPYKDLLIEHPEMKININRYFADIQEILDQPGTPAAIKEKFRTYIPDVRKTLREYTQNELGAGEIKANKKYKKYHKKGKTKAHPIF